MRSTRSLSPLATAVAFAACAAACTTIDVPLAPVASRVRPAGDTLHASPSVDVGFGPGLFYYARRDSNAVSTFGTISTGGAIVDRFGSVSRIVALTFAAADLGYGPDLFYYLRRDPSGFTTFGTLSSSGQAIDRFGVGNTFDALAFAAPDIGYGPALFYYLRRDASGLSILGTISTAGGVIDRFGVGEGLVALAFAAPDVGYGDNLLYYIRHEPNSGGLSTFGTISTNGAIIDRFGVGHQVIALAFAPDDAGLGANLFYYVRTVVGTTLGTFGTIATSGSIVDRFGVGADIDALTFADGGAPVSLTAVIDVAPGTFPNVVNLSVDRFIAVAVVSSATVRPRTITPASVRFGASGTEVAASSWTLTDVNGDQRPDLVFRFAAARTGLRCGVRIARLTGTTTSLRPFEGQDVVVVRGCR